MSNKKFLPLNSSGVDHIIPIDAAGTPGQASSWGWYSKDVAGNVDPRFTITFTNDGDGNILSSSFYMVGDVVINGTLTSSGLFIGGNSNFVGDVTVSGGTLYVLNGLYATGGTLYGTYFFEGPGGVQFDVGTYFTQGLHVGSGATIFDNSVTCNADFNHTQGYANFDSLVRVQNNVVIGSTFAGTDANKVLALHNSATAPSDSADLVQLYAVDLSAGNATLGLSLERAVAIDAAVISTHTLTVKINGTNYRLLLAT